MGDEFISHQLGHTKNLGVQKIHCVFFLNHSLVTNKWNTKTIITPFCVAKLGLIFKADVAILPKVKKCVIALA